MAIRWKIPFVSLRTGARYTANVYDSSYSGQPVTLKGGSNPFVTEEDASEDPFAPVRTQSGYLRIVDDGKDAYGNVFSWEGFAPATDTDRPVVLLNGSGNIVWQGYLQPRTFSSTLFVTPQEREFPLQCVLTAMNTTDVPTNVMELKNFAYLLWLFVSNIPSLTISKIYIQGGEDARRWLLKVVDMMNFVSGSDEGSATAAYDLSHVVEDVCRFWGWTLRTSGQCLYLTKPCDTDNGALLVLTPTQLSTLASGVSAGTIESTGSVALAGDIFANMNNTEDIVRPKNKATVHADANAASEILATFPSIVVKEMQNGGTYTVGKTGFGVRSKDTRRYTTDLQSYSTLAQEGSARSGYASFNIGTYYDEKQGHIEKTVIRVKKSFTSTDADAYAVLSTNRHHTYCEGVFHIEGDVMRVNTVLSDEESKTTPNIYVRFGVGETRSTAKWYSGGSLLSSSQDWVSTPTAFKVNVKRSGTEYFVSIPISKKDGIGLRGRVFFEILGSDDIDKTDGERSFDLTDVVIIFERLDYTYTVDVRKSGRFKRKSSHDMNATHEYTAKNGGNVRDEWDCYCIFASGSKTAFGYGLVAETDGTYMGTATYSGTEEIPERHQAELVSGYWSTSKRKIACELRYNETGEIIPTDVVTVNGVTGFSIGIGHNWRDDIVKLTMMEG